MKITKWIIAVSAGVLIFASCQNNTPKEEELVAANIIMNPNTAEEGVDSTKVKLPVIKFEYTDFDFGLIYEGEKVVHKFKFTNTGNADLIISDVSASCGCTVPKYSKKPLSPGEEGFIEVEFNSAGREGQQHKSVTVLANTQPNRVELTFIAEVEVNK